MRQLDRHQSETARKLWRRFCRLVLNHLREKTIPIKSLEREIRRRVEQVVKEEYYDRYDTHCLRVHRMGNRRRAKAAGLNRSTGKRRKFPSLLGFFTELTVLDINLKDLDFPTARHIAWKGIAAGVEFVARELAKKENTDPPLHTFLPQDWDIIECALRNDAIFEAVPFFFAAKEDEELEAARQMLNKALDSLRGQLTFLGIRLSANADLCNSFRNWFIPYCVYRFVFPPLECC